MKYNGSRGELNGSWKGGKSKERDSIIIRCQCHPRAGSNGYVYEHILIVEKAIGKFLRITAPVHHIDNNRDNNCNSNLIACDSNSYHRFLHKRHRAFDACGHANWLKCKYCKEYDKPDNLYIPPGKDCGAFHKECSNKYARKNYDYSKGREKYEKYREKSKTTKRKYYLEHKEQIIAQHKEYRERIREDNQSLSRSYSHIALTGERRSAV